MQGGDLAASEPIPQVYVVLEGLILLPGPRFTQKRFARRIRMHRYRSAVHLLEYNDIAVNTLWNLWMASQPVCLVTYLPVSLLAEIRRDLDENEIPHLRTFQTTERFMAKTIAQRRDALLVFDADPDRGLMYGPKGRIIRPDHAEIMEKCL
jgi:hypothetical protein